MNAKHTPGPWHVEDPMGDICLSIVDDAEHTYDWKMVANVTWSGKDEKGQPSFVSYKTAEANARLIAAAPEMLEALIAIDQWDSRPGFYSRGDAFRKVLNAIEKAGGKRLIG